MPLSLSCAPVSSTYYNTEHHQCAAKETPTLQKAKSSVSHLPAAATDLQNLVLRQNPLYVNRTIGQRRQLTDKLSLPHFLSPSLRPPSSRYVNTTLCSALLLNLSLYKNLQIIQKSGRTPGTSASKLPLISLLG